MRTSLTLLAVNSSSNGKILRALPALDSYVRLTMIDYTILVELKKERKEDFELARKGKGLAMKKDGEREPRNGFGEGDSSRD